MGNYRLSSLKWEINNVRISIDDRLEHWLEKNFCTIKTDQGIMELNGIKIENILKEIINNHSNTKIKTIVLSSENLQIFEQVTQELKD